MQHPHYPIGTIVKLDLEYFSNFGAFGIVMSHQEDHVVVETLHLVKWFEGSVPFGQYYYSSLLPAWGKND